MRQQKADEAGRDRGEEKINGKVIIMFFEDVGEDFGEVATIVDKKGKEGAKIDEFEKKVEVGGAIGAEKMTDQLEVSRTRNRDKFG